MDGRGRPWRDHRQVVNGVLWRLRTGAPWRDFPQRYGPWQTVYERFARWEADGTWAKLLEHVQVRDDAVGRVEWTVSADSTINRAHQHAAGARKKGPQTGTNWKTRAGRRRVRALGRSRGGLTMKVHLAVDGRGPRSPSCSRPATSTTPPPSARSSTASASRAPSPAAPPPRPQRVLGDKAYSSRAIRNLLRRRGIAATIPERRDQAANRCRRGALGGRPPAFDKDIYRDRNVVERCFARLKQFRAIATRFDKLADRYRAGLMLASLILWLREPAG
ncbi:IS5 family transposase [Streptomyces sp. NPDC056716]|uniref:IS5 family transposase n=1 Tax=unclassified Streptomyces TaxID=2593676 RepID=UPI0036A3B66A